MLSDSLELNNRQDTIAILERLYKKGYRYVVREKESPYLVCFSLKPKRYRKDEMWGYVNPDANGVIGAYPIKNTDITEITWNNRSATPILQMIKDK